MVKYKSGEIDPADLEPGRYYVRTFTPIRGNNTAKTEYDVLQVRRKNINGEERYYWHKVKDLINGRPPPVSARVLGLVPTKYQIEQYEKGNNVFVSTAFDQDAEHPTSHFKLTRRSDGDGVSYHFSIDWSKSPEADRLRKKRGGGGKPKKPRNGSASGKKSNRGSSSSNRK